MAKYFVTTTVEFCGEVEADTYEQAEEKGWEWEDELVYGGVVSINVSEMEDYDSED